MEDISTNNQLGGPAAKSNKKFIFGIFGGILFLVFFYYLFLSAPALFPVPVTVQVPEGVSLRGVSLRLKNAHIIRSRTAFEAFVIIYGREKHVVANGYYFDSKLSVYEIARRIVAGESHIPPLAVTIPEGFDVVQIADAFVLKLVNFNRDTFLLKAKSKEGYLFPDTYYFLNNATEESVLKAMSDNFDKKIFALRSAIISSGKSEEEIIIMASLVEREAKGDTDRGFISGILWRRLKIGMPLQVDAAPETYKTKGLPDSPIANAGLEAIMAAIRPQSSPYLYYLHDKDGNIHYAKNFSEHLQNKLKYLR